VIADRSFLYVSEVGPMCDEINVCVVRAPDAPHDLQIVAEELSEDPCAEAALQPGAVWGDDTIRLCIAGETED